MGWGLAGRGLGGGGGVTATWAAAEVLQVQFIDKVVDVLMQLEFQQSRVCNGQFIDRVLDISVAHREVPTVQTVQKTVLGVDVPCDQQR